MNAADAIIRLSRALELVSAEECFDKDELLGLVEDILHEKHWEHVQQGLLRDDKTLIVQGLMGALGHYEAAQEKERTEKRIGSLKR
ncbi:MAG TPA: hypothetical protein VJJ82_02835 [Candidatus Nanoarchaeia archaeon]|nr:hypothetical protein [Candidatus Nanoarchaeia archaeon]